jgi:MFS family permease
MIRDRSLSALLAGEFVSRLGSQFTSLALPWFVLVTTGSASKMGLVFAAELAPVALFGIPSASLVQRLGPKRWMVLMDALRVPVVAAVPFLAQANGLVEGTTNVTNLLGPALAGILISLIGAANVMWVDAAWYLVSVVLIGVFVRVGKAVREDTEDLGGIFAGLRYLRRDTLLARVSLSSLVFGFVFPMLAASFPVLAFEQYDRNARVAGLLLAIIGYVVAGTLFAHAGLYATYAVIAVLGTLATLNFVVAVGPIRDHAAQAA